MLSYSEIEKKIGYVFENKELLKLALTHKSYAYEKGDTSSSCYNERLEFLGDAILEHIVSIYLYNLTPLLKEGVMSKKRAEIVCEKSLSEVIKRTGLSKHVMLGKCETTTGGNKKDAILADMFEAILGAIYLDGGFDKAQTTCMKLLEATIIQVLNEKDSLDYKTRLQELLQKNGAVKIEYILDKEVGKAHAKTFYSSVYFEGEKIGEGNGKTKKASEQAAAAVALKKLEN
ncbi:MAG: ribonuclease III [Clostridia bacterium]|nr:ribonuclease III [Clostridia bacterium]